MSEFIMYRPPKKCNRCGVPIARNSHCNRCRVIVNVRAQELRRKKGLKIRDIDIVCKVCGKIGHRPITCPQAPPPEPPALCGRCRERGHEEKDCPNEWGPVELKPYANRALQAIEEADEAERKYRLMLSERKAAETKREE